MGSENKDKQHRSVFFLGGGVCFVFKDLKLKGKKLLERNPKIWDRGGHYHSKFMHLIWIYLSIPTYMSV